MPCLCRSLSLFLAMINMLYQSPSLTHLPELSSAATTRAEIDSGNSFALWPASAFALMLRPSSSSQDGRPEKVELHNNNNNNYNFVRERAHLSDRHGKQTLSLFLRHSLLVYIHLPVQLRLSSCWSPRPLPLLIIVIAPSPSCPIDLRSYNCAPESERAREISLHSSSLCDAVDELGAGQA